MGDSASADVKVESQWQSLQADADLPTRVQHLKARIFTGLEALSEVLPKYSEDDFVVVHRKNPKGVWKAMSIPTGPLTLGR